MTWTRSGNRLPKVVSRDDAKKLLSQPNTKCPTGLRNRAMLELMYRGGLRCGEVLGLTVADIKTDEQRVDVRHTKRDKSRAVFVPELAMFWIERWMEKRELLGLDKKTNLVFCTLHGDEVSARYVRQMVDRIAERAGVDKQQVSPHVFRHTFATELLEEGFSIREVQEALGHSSISTTEVYLHVRPEEMRQKMLARREPADIEGQKQTNRSELLAAVMQALDGLDEDEKRNVKDLLRMR